MSLQALSDYTIISRYSRYKKDKKRRETWGEMTDRVFEMHSKKYEEALKSDEFKEDFEFAKDFVKKKRVLGSQRALQFGGDPIFKHEAKMYNCSFGYIDRVSAFSECMYLLLCGCGVGFSVQQKHISKLPNISRPTYGKKTFKIQDSIEGWADAVKVLVESYFITNNSEYFGYDIQFDFSDIREEGTLIAGQFKAPGPNGLNISLEKMREIFNDRLNSEENRLRDIDVYDLIMHTSDSVLSGGVRRSATICLFSKTSEEMMKAKTGDWFVKNPQRGRSNNSVLLIKDDITEKEFSSIMKSTKDFGEPGFVFSESEDIGYNPCQPAWATILTKDGIRKFSEISEGDEIWSETGWTKIIKKWSTGVKDVYRYGTTGGCFYGTDNHRLVSHGVKIKAKETDSVDLLTGHYNDVVKLNPQDIIDGIVFGDGSVHKASNNLVYLNIGANDQDYFDSDISSLILKHRPGLADYAWEITTTITSDELPHTYIRYIPDRFIYASRDEVCGFLRGLYSANGSVVSKRVTLKASSFKVIEQVQFMLSSIGIKSYYTTNKAQSVSFGNGEYVCKQSYDLNISVDIEKFYNLVGFLQNYKMDKLWSIVSNNKRGAGKFTYDIISCDFVSTEEVFDITVDNETHTYWTGGLNVSNCVEIGLYPQTKDGKSGWQFCNLTEINGKFCDTKEKFYDACRASAILGTMQAGYTNFKYLSDETREITEQESLLGCSVTGVMDNPDIILSPEIQRRGAEIVKETNKKIAKLIGINQAARTTAIKPAGSTSCVLSSSSGIHPHHAKRYIRRVQANRSEFPLQYFQKKNPLAVEKSVWSANGTDYVISFLCEVPKHAITKNKLSAVDLLEKVKLTQQNWVEFGTNTELCSIPSLRHNVSNTITVKEDEWGDVEKFIFDNRAWFAGISLLPASGDLDYPQAPFTSVLDAKELIETYGDGALMASGLIVDGLNAFNDNLWAACDSLNGIGEVVINILEPVEPIIPSKNKTKADLEKVLSYYNDLELYEKNFKKIDWIRRSTQFAGRYFEGNIKKMCHCLKHVYTFKQWIDLKREYIEVDWSEAIEEDETFVDADTMGAIGCSGGSCELR